MKANTPPGPATLPLIGNTHQILRNDLLEWFTELATEHGEVVKLDVVGKTIISVTDPEIVEQVLIHQNDHFRKGGFQKKVTSSLLGNGLVLSEGETWRNHRHDIETAFHPDEMALYAEIIQKHTEEQLSTWSDSQVIDIEDEMKELTLSIIAEALFDIDLRNNSWELEDAFTRIIEHFEKIGQTYIYIPEQIPTRSNREYKEAISKLDEVIDKIIHLHKTGEIERDTLISHLLKQVGETDHWTRKDIRDQIATLLLAGHETTALMLTFSSYLLATNPEVQQTTADSILNNSEGDATTRRGFGGPIENILKESMRIYPPVYAVFHEPTRDTTFNGYHIPEGAIIALNLWTIHRDNDNFSDPLQFKPSRWTDDLEKSLTPGMYFPFAAGPRRCVGERLAKLEGQIVLEAILQDYRLHNVSDAPLEVAPSLTTQPKNQIELRIEKR